MPSFLSPELRWLIPHIKPHLALHVRSFLSLTLASMLSLVTPLSIRWLIDHVLPAHDLALLVVAIVGIFASYEARATLVAVGGYLTLRATLAAALGLRLSLLLHLDSLSSEYFDRTPVGELLYPFEGPIDEISYFGTDLFPSILRTAVATIVTLSAMTILSPALTLLVSPIVPLFLLVRRGYRKKIGQEADLVQAAGNKVAAFLAEHFCGLTQIQLLRQCQRQELKVSELLTNRVLTQEALAKTGAHFSVLSNLTIAAGIAATLARGSVMVFRGVLTVGSLVAFYTLLVELFDPLITAMEMYARAQRAFSSIRRVQAVFAIPVVVKNPAKAKILDSSSSVHLAFRNISFGYRRDSALIRIPNLEIAQGQRVAIVGPNGAGKSTVGKLLARLYDVDSGQISVAGLDLRGFDLVSLRSSICYLPAQPILFHRSVADNLRIGKHNSTVGEMERVLRTVGLTSLLEGSPASLEKSIQTNGQNLSSGERQRIALARTLLHRPRILILDETTCSLDPVSEETLLRKIERVLSDSTLIVITHRLQSILWMERILLMRQGEIVGDGDHSALSRTNSLYRKLAGSTLSES
jgi:ABC-type multidrug transport system fused ATPase/permease subunit